MAFEDDSRHTARAIGPVVLGTSEHKGTPYIELYFEVTEGASAGERVRWTGYFHETKDKRGKTGAERLIDTLLMMGWVADGGDISCFQDGELHGIDKNEVAIVVELESYDDKDTGEPRFTPRVKWVNKLGGFLNVQNQMKPDAAASFGEKMRGLVLKAKSKQKELDTGTDFPPAEQKQASGAKKGW